MAYTSAIEWLREKAEAAQNDTVSFSEAEFPFDPAYHSEFTRDDTFSLKLGADVVYREDTPRRSLQVRYFADANRYDVQLDEYNPRYGVTAAGMHAAVDATEYTVPVLTAMAVAVLSDR